VLSAVGVGIFFFVSFIGFARFAGFAGFGEGGGVAERMNETACQSARKYQNLAGARIINFCLALVVGIGYGNAW
jgi:hypothetical protein